VQAPTIARHAALHQARSFRIEFIHRPSTAFHEMVNLLRRPPAVVVPCTSFFRAVRHLCPAPHREYQTDCVTPGLLLPVHGSERSIVFSIVANFREHDNSSKAARNLMKFCTNMYLDNL